MLHKYHVRYVSDLAPGLRPLAKENEITISSRKILTFQGHPEMTNEISRLLVEGDDGTYKQRKDIQSLPDGALMLDVSTLHDGIKAWKDILRWAHQ
jgi:GMP synthase-like glutamine amidotransferase